MRTAHRIRHQNGLNFLTCTTVGWIDIFSRAAFRDIILDSWRYCAKHKGLQIWAYVIMTNHLHMIVNTKSPYKLSDVMRDFKAHTAREILAYLHDRNKVESRREWLLNLHKFFAYPKRHSQDFQVWQNGSYPIELYSEKVTRQKLNYIHDNPVRAKLVSQPEEWLYSSASNYELGHGIYDVHLLWTPFDEDGGWFFGNVPGVTLD